MLYPSPSPAGVLPTATAPVASQLCSHQNKLWGPDATPQQCSVRAERRDTKTAVPCTAVSTAIGVFTSVTANVQRYRRHASFLIRCLGDSFSVAVHSVPRTLCSEHLTANHCLQDKTRPWTRRRQRDTTCRGGCMSRLLLFQRFFPRVQIVHHWSFTGKLQKETPPCNNSNNSETRD